jgi:hypothetical protein
VCLESVCNAKIFLVARTATSRDASLAITGIPRWEEGAWSDEYFLYMFDSEIYVFELAIFLEQIY